MRITTKGQVTIPQVFREKLGLLPETEVEFEIAGKTLVLRKAKEPSLRGQRLVTRMRGAATARMTTDQIMALTRGK